MIESVLPPTVRGHDKFKVVRGPQGVVTEMRLPNGSTIIFGSADQDALTFEGTRIDWAWCDEPVAPFIFNGIWRGLIVDEGTILFTLTPLGAKAAWMYKKWVKPGADEADQATVVKVQQRDNKALSEKAILEFENNGEWTEAEKRARLHGDFESLGNRAIHNFNPDHHVITARPLPPHWRKYQSVDPHHARLPAVLWAKRDPLSRQLHIIDEYPHLDFVKLKAGGKAPSELAVEFRNIEGREPAVVRVCDPRFGKSEARVHGQKTPCWVDLMGNAGLYYDARIPNIARIESGEQKIVEMLRFDTRYPVSPTNQPQLIIHDNCKNLIAALENYGIMPERDPTKGEPEKRSEEYKDFIDALRYLVLYEEPVDMDEMPGSFSAADLDSYNNGETW